MNNFTCVYYLTDSGRSPVEEFLGHLKQCTRKKYFSRVSLLEEYEKGFQALIAATLATAFMS